MNCPNCGTIMDEFPDRWDCIMCGERQIKGGR